MRIGIAIAIAIAVVVPGCKDKGASDEEKVMKEVVDELCKCTDPVCLTEVQTRVGPKLKQVAEKAPDLLEKYDAEITKCSKQASGIK